MGIVEFDKDRDAAGIKHFEEYKDKKPIPYKTFEPEFRDFCYGADWAYKWCEKYKIFEPYGDVIARKDKETATLEKRLYEALKVAQEASNFKKSLEFYANQENWRYSDANNTNGMCIKNRIAKDDCSEYSNENSSGGKRAREALKRIESERK